ncbi:hypothetical protein HBI40_124070 [Parastagonospora nodorum]|nr:hypothetical protein HBI41_123620 [Parastagonospora nodorum]KAH6285596.1 hypothetical protein HBI40_124070 [Parastagonospora nodorum]
MSFGRLQAALTAATSEVTLAAANINFDFTLVKIEAPQEYTQLGSLLPAAKKSEAESGSTHVTARRLGTLFDGVCPHTPNLIKAYGTRVSEISTIANDQISSHYRDSIFGAHSGVDGTTIWAAATSSNASLHVHLLACMLARIFEASEAVSIWVELEKERRLDIAGRFDRGENVQFSLASAAAQNPISKQQLADWDSSARAWLRTADEVKRNESRQLHTLLKDLNLAVNEQTKVYPSVIEAWKNALNMMEDLVCGRPQAVQDGSVILGLSAWHLYPPLVVFGGQNFRVNMDDRLVKPGGELSIGLSSSIKTKDTLVYWCLSLAHLRHYGKPVRTEGRIQEDPTRCSFQEFMYGVIGAITNRWQIPSQDTLSTMKFFALVHMSFDEANAVAGRYEWVALLGRTAKDYLGASEVDAAGAERIFQLGRRRSELFIGPIQFEAGHNRKQDGGYITGDPRYLGLLDANVLTGVTGLEVESLIELLRHKLQRDPTIRCADYLIQYKSGVSRKRKAKHSGGRHSDSADAEMEDDDDLSNHNQSCYAYATVSPTWDHRFRFITNENTGDTDEKLSRMQHRWVNEGSHAIPLTERIHTLNANHLRRNGFDLMLTDMSSTAQCKYSWVFGDMETAAVFVREGSKPIVQSSFHVDDFVHCHKKGLLSHTKIMSHVMKHGFPSSVANMLGALSTVDGIYEKLSGATVSLKCFEKPLLESKWYNWSSLHRGATRRKLALAIVSYFDSGSCDLDPEDLDQVIAVSTGDSIYVPAQLVCDPLKRHQPHVLKRILGNIGKPGVVLLNPPQGPMMRDLEFTSVSMPKFDGTKQDCFGATSLHLSFTGLHMPMYDTNVKVGRDSQVSILESVMSVRDRGNWVADINILDALSTDFDFKPVLNRTCRHEQTQASFAGVYSIESWDDILDHPVDKFVVRTHGNWAARLAAYSVLAQAMKEKGRSGRITVCEPDTCWQCLFRASSRGGYLLHGFID